MAAARLREAKRGPERKMLDRPSSSGDLSVKRRATWGTSDSGKDMIMPEDAVSGSDFLSEIMGGMGGGDTSPPSAPSDTFDLVGLLEELRERLFDSNPVPAGFEEFISNLLDDGPSATQEQESTAQTTVEPEWEGNVPPVLTDWGDFLL